MTDAHICNQTTQDNKNTATDGIDDCTRNTHNDFLEQEDCKTDDVIIVANDDEKQNETETTKTDHKTDTFEENCENVILENKLANQVKNSDTVLKYVYKNDVNVNNKTRGHVKNSLKRKKRSLLSDSELHTHRQPRKFQINDHRTNGELVPKTKPKGIINKDDLADFNIQTVHENIKPAINILMKDSQGIYNNYRQNHNTKEYGSDEVESNENEDNTKIKSTVHDIPKYTKKTKDIKSEGVVKDRIYLSENIENKYHDRNEDKNIKSTEYDRDSISNGNIDEPINVENNSNENIENDREKLPQKVEDGSSEYIIKDIRNIKGDSFNKDDRRNDYTKESKDDNNESKEYELKDSRNLKSDSFNKDNDYPKDSNNDNNESKEYEQKDSRNIKSASFNKDNDYTIESKDDNNESKEYELKDSRHIKSDSFNKDDRRNDYTKESSNDNNESKEYELKDSKNIKSDTFNEDNRRNDYTKESNNDNNESKEYEVKDNRNIKGTSFNKDNRPNDYTKESKNDNEGKEYELKYNRNIKSASFNKDDRSNDFTEESKDGEDEDERKKYEVKGIENIKSSHFKNYNKNKLYSNNDKGSKSESNEDYLTDPKHILNSDENLDADSFEKSVPTPKNNVSDISLDLFKTPQSNNNKIINNDDLKETSEEGNEKVNDIEKTKLLNKDEGVNGNKKRNNSINLEEVDLDDFSYETIQDEKDKSNAPIINLNKSNERSSLPGDVEIIPNTLEKPFTGTKPSVIKNAYENEKQIKINDDEIKPVKELNYSESQSEEESKEYKRSEKEESINDRLKSIVEKSHKAVNEREKTDVKAQFERIPENYKHTDAKSTTEIPVVENSDAEGTLDSFTPNNYEYDKDLNIKFSDITIKLPEIKLPKDILAYAREEQKNNKEDYDNSKDIEQDDSEDKEKDNLDYKENEEDKEDEGEEIEEYIKKPKIYDNIEQNREDFYQSYFNPPSYDLSNDNPKKKEKFSNVHNKDSDEDLYEKFVRERFGKRNDLKKRSEKLIDYEPISKNYNLYKSVRKALKKANKIEKEAEKNKDPNYMWTLEYGGKL